MTGDPRDVRWCRGPSTLTSCLLAVVLAVPLAGSAVAGVGSGVTPSAAGRVPVTADRPRTGYPLASDGTAGGAWIGSRTAGRQVVYRIDPLRGPLTPGFEPARWAATIRGSGPVTVTRWRVRRAAWLLSKYGVYDAPAQSAAVELTLAHLLHGGSHRLGGDLSRRRLAQSGAQDAIVPLATYLLDASRRLAGPYRVSVSATGADVGGRAGVTVTVTAQRTGEPIPHLPVTVTFDGQRLAGTTDETGEVALAAPARQPGPRAVRVLVQRLPSHRLLLRRPSRASASRVVVAGRKTAAARSAVVAIRARPVVRVSVPGPVATNLPVPGTLWVTGGYPTSRAARLTLHGPFPDAASATCAPDTVAGMTSPVTGHPVTGDGAYPIAPVPVAEPGLYRWSATVAGNSYNLPATGCGEPFVVRAAPRVAVRPTEAAIRSGGLARARITVSGLPPGYADEVTARLYGPFATRAQAGCDAGSLVRRRTVAVAAPSTTARPEPVRLTRPGVYTWQAVLPGATLSSRVVTGCGIRGSFVRVR